MFEDVAMTDGGVVLGAYAVPINWHWRSGEIEHVLVDSGAKVLVVHADLLDEARAVVPAYGHFSYQRRGGSRQEIDWNGIITSGDIGYVDEDGWLFISDRRADLIVSGGVNVYPAEIEAVLITMPGVVVP